MSVKLQRTKDYICAEISGEIDHFSAAEIRLEIDSAVRNRPARLLILDFGGVQFMDSSGIGLILGRKKLIEEYSGAIVIKNPTKAVRKIITLSGLSKLIIDS